MPDQTSTTYTKARIVSAHGRHYIVELANGQQIECVSRGKKSEAACGDYVDIKMTGESQGVIEAIQPRSTLLYRSDAFREKIVAANISQVVIVLAVAPPFSDEILTRCILAAHEQKLPILIILNKIDLTEKIDATRLALTPYREMGYPVIELSAKNDVGILKTFLQGHTSVFTGQSGMGKSTLINALIPHANAATREISSVLNSGKHTTTHTSLYHLDSTSSLIDSPGMQLFGLHHLSFSDIEQGFQEFLPYLGHCRFHNCHHTHEPDCAIQNAVREGKINTRRYDLFLKISREHSGNA